MVSDDGESSSDPVTPKRKVKLERPRSIRGDKTKSNTSEAIGSRLGQAPTPKSPSVEILTPRKRSSARVSQRAQKESPSKSQTIPPLPSKRHVSVISSPEMANDDDEDDDEEEELVVRPSTARSRRQRNKPMIDLDGSEESEDDIVTSSPAKRRKRNVEYKPPQTPNKHSEQDQLDLAEDLEDIQDSGTFYSHFLLQKPIY